MIQLFIEELNNLNFRRKFFSSSLYEKVAKYFAEISKNGTIMLIIIKNNVTNGHSNYCYYIAELSCYKSEKEILISSHCNFTIINIISFFLEEFLLEQFEYFCSSIITYSLISINYLPELVCFF